VKGEHQYYFELGEQKEAQCCLLKYTIIG